MIDEQKKRTNLTDDKKSWVDIFPLPNELHLSKESFKELWKLHPKEKGKIMIYGKEIETPRYLQSYGLPYKFSGKEHDAKPFPPFIKRYLDYANSLKEYTKDFGQFNMCLVNWYRDGTNYISYHSDDETRIVTDKMGNTTILSISFGQQRRFLLRNKLLKDTKEFKLLDNNVLIMGGTTQKTHNHSVPKEMKVQDKRINLTFRIFK